MAGPSAGRFLNLSWCSALRATSFDFISRIASVLISGAIGNDELSRLLAKILSGTYHYVSYDVWSRIARFNTQCEPPLKRRGVWPLSQIILRSLRVSYDDLRPRQVKNRITSETLLLQLSTSESNHEQSDVSWQEPESEVKSSRTLPDPTRKSRFVLVKNAKKRWRWAVSRCETSYCKPGRLEKRERLHTGEVCPPC